MARANRIGREIKVTIADCIVVDEHNDMHDETVKLYGDYSNDMRVQNAVRKKLGNSRVLVKNYRMESFFASMSTEEFVKHAKITEHPKTNKE